MGELIESLAGAAELLDIFTTLDNKGKNQGRRGLGRENQRR